MNYWNDKVRSLRQSIEVLDVKISEASDEIVRVACVKQKKVLEKELEFLLKRL